MSKNKVILTILDGFGISHANYVDDTTRLDNVSDSKKSDKYNAIIQANPKNWLGIQKNNPKTELLANGFYVGLPYKQAGNSEVGHLTIGSGRVTELELTKINREITDNVIGNNQALQEFIAKTKQEKGHVHLIGLISDGGVHGHLTHIKPYLAEFKKANLKVYLHAISDGRDTSPEGSIKFLEKLDLPFCSIIGRYYIMDRDKNWQRTKEAFDLLINSKGSKVDSITNYLSQCYQDKITDEFIPKAQTQDFQAIAENDGIFLLNFRADRARQIIETLVSPDFSGFDRKKFKPRSLLSLTSIRNDLDKLIKIAYPKQILKNTLGEIVAKQGLKQLRLAESEKYAHVTYFFSGGNETVFDNEERILIPSKKVKTYDLLPKMSAYEIYDALSMAIKKEDFDLIIVNFANCDMVGHTGSLEAAISAVKVIDEIVGKLNEVAISHKYTLLLTADHGNAEQMFDEKTQLPHTSHTNNNVPFVVAGYHPYKFSLKAFNSSSDETKELNNKIKPAHEQLEASSQPQLEAGSQPQLEAGSQPQLKDIAATILDILEIEKPKEMTGRSLIVKD